MIVCCKQEGTGPRQSARDSRSDPVPWPGKPWRTTDSVIEARKTSLSAWLNALLPNQSIGPLLKSFLDMKAKDEIATSEQKEILVVIACDCGTEHDHDEAFHSSSGPPIVQDGVSPDSRSLGWLAPGMCIQVLDEETDERTGDARVRITWRGDMSRQDMWVTKVTSKGTVFLTDVGSRDWVNVDEAASNGNPMKRAADGPVPGLMPMNWYSSAHSRSYGGGAPTPSVPVAFMVSEKDTLLDGPVVGMQWSTDGQVAPLDFEVQWGYRWSGGWATASPYRLETIGMAPTEVAVKGSGKQGIDMMMQWTAQVAVQRVAERSDDVPHEQSYVVQMRAL